jgi:4-oxalocrotonate tautomerase
MPLIQISLVQGRDAEVVKRFVKDIARTAHESLGAPMETIRVIVNEVPPTHWGVGDQTRDDIDAAKRDAARKALL